jgi:DNA-directed RNA polymerase specialized sigma24 family protein
MKSTEIARKYQINEWTVHHRLKRAGIAKRPTSMNEDQVDLSISLRVEGLTYDRIAARVGFSASTVRKVLKRAGQ